MPHQFGCLINPPAGTYYPDPAESRSGGTGVAPTQLTFMGDVAANQLFPTDGSKHAVIYTIFCRSSSGNLVVQENYGGDKVVDTALSANEATILDFGAEGARLDGGFSVTVPAGSYFVVVYDLVDA